MVTPSLRPTQTFNCSTDGSSFYFYPLEVEDCNVCTGEPLVENGTTDWSAQVNYSVGQSVRATCNESYLCSVYSDEQDIACSPVGWMNATPCYEACVDPPPTAGVNMAMENLTWNGIGAVLRYRCDEGHYIPPNICAGTTLCLRQSTVIIHGIILRELKATQSTTPARRRDSSGISNALYRLRVKMTGNGASYRGVTLLVEFQPPYWVGSIANYTCPDGKMSPRGDTCTSVVANETGWSVLDPEFGCYNACQAPPAVPLHAWANESEAWIWGTEVTYICPGEFEGGGFNYTTVCVDGNWTLFELPYCKGMCGWRFLPTPGIWSNTTTSDSANILHLVLYHNVGISRRPAFAPIPHIRFCQHLAFGPIPRRQILPTPGIWSNTTTIWSKTSTSAYADAWHLVQYHDIRFYYHLAFGPTPRRRHMLTPGIWSSNTWHNPKPGICYNTKTSDSISICRRQALGPKPQHRYMPTSVIWSNITSDSANTWHLFQYHDVSLTDARHLVQFHDVRFCQHLAFGLKPRSTPGILSNTTSSAYADARHFVAAHFVKYHVVGKCQRPAFCQIPRRRHMPTPGILSNTTSSAYADARHFVKYHVVGICNARHFVKYVVGICHARHFVKYHVVGICQRPAFCQIPRRRHMPTPGILSNTTSSAYADARILSNTTSSAYANARHFVNTTSSAYANARHFVKYHVVAYADARILSNTTSSICQFCQIPRRRHMQRPHFVKYHVVGICHARQFCQIRRRHNARHFVKYHVVGICQRPAFCQIPRRRHMPRRHFVKFVSICQCPAFCQIPRRRHMPTAGILSNTTSSAYANARHFVKYHVVGICQRPAFCQIPRRRHMPTPGILSNTRRMPTPGILSNTTSAMPRPVIIPRRRHMPTPAFCQNQVVGICQRPAFCQIPVVGICQRAYNHVVGICQRILSNTTSSAYANARHFVKYHVVGICRFVSRRHMPPHFVKYTSSAYAGILSNTTSSAYADARHFVKYPVVSICQCPAFCQIPRRRHMPTPGIRSNTTSSAYANARHFVKYHVVGICRAAFCQIPRRRICRRPAFCQIPRRRHMPTPSILSNTTSSAYADARHFVKYSSHMLKYHVVGICRRPAFFKYHVVAYATPAFCQTTSSAYADARHFVKYHVVGICRPRHFVKYHVVGICGRHFVKYHVVGHMPTPGILSNHVVAYANARHCQIPPSAYAGHFVKYHVVAYARPAFCQIPRRRHMPTPAFVKYHVVAYANAGILSSSHMPTPAF
ncbi:hypothetical protein C7M84_017584 [Penaeus vannamei]|uniref:Sushi domain-containing protein n=1 Tax=Penaeus vannamei TaxID=6689 RepID=A0A3R7NR50_PENVA|nr:hypothetical protein C7M84_017584 [Penaeus vannamei]